MNSKIAGIALMVIVILMLTYIGFSYATTKKVVDVGPIQINEKTHRPVERSPVIAAVLLVGGIVIVTWGKKP
jgi:Ca2+/Na+ antiporter